MRFKEEGTAVYHCISRVAGGDWLLDRQAKEVLRKMLWRVAAFSGVEVLTYCLMSNHFHVLVRVPEARDEELTREELVRRYRLLYEVGSGTFPDADVMAVILGQDTEEAAEWAAKLRARMNDVSAFMKTLKQRFSWWYNKSRGRFGTLWAERFKSVLVEDSPHALKTVAAYIDLNPVRAGLVEDPGAYRWSGYGEALGGERAAQTGLASVVGAGLSRKDPRKKWTDFLADYRMVLFGKGADGRVREQGLIPREVVLEALASGGKLPAEVLIRCRIRYLTAGAIIGSEAYVRKVGGLLSGRTGGEAKTLGKLPASEVSALYSWRRLQVRAIG